MLEKIIALFRDPLIRNAFFSGLVLIFLFTLFLLLRRTLNLFHLEDEKKRLTFKGLRWALFLLGLILLGRIWVYTEMQNWLSPAVTQKLIISLLGLLVFGSVIVFVRHFIKSQIKTLDKQRTYLNSVSWGLGLLYGIILIRTWAITEYQFFQDPFMRNVFRSLISLGVIWVVLYFLRRFVNSLKIDIVMRHTYRKRLTYVGALAYGVALFVIWAGRTQQWTTILSVMGAGIALALHEVLLNIAGWAFIMARRPYRTGDRIELGPVKGDVIDIQFFQTTLLEIGNWVGGDQSTGRLVHLPHGQIFRTPLFNYTKGFEYIWNEFSILVTFESNWEAARAILLTLGDEASREIQDQVKSKIHRMARDYLIYYKSFTPIVYTKIEESGVKLTLRFLTDAKKRRSIEDEISRKTLKAVENAPDVEFAYPTYRITGK